MDEEQLSKMSGEEIVEYVKKNQDNFDIVMQAVKLNPYLLEFAGEGLRDNPDIVMAAISQEKCGRSLQYASERLRNEPEIVKVAMQNAHHWDDIFQYASDELKNNREIVMEAVKHQRYVLDHVDERFLKDPDIIIEATKLESDNVRYANQDMRKNTEFWKNLIYRGNYSEKEFDRATSNIGILDGNVDKRTIVTLGDAFTYLKNMHVEDWRKHEDLLKSAIKLDPDIIQFANDELKKDPSFMKRMGDLQRRTKLKYKIKDIMKKISPRKKDIDEVVYETKTEASREEKDEIKQQDGNTQADDDGLR